MGKATQRREQRDAERLRRLASEQPEHFQRVWQRRLHAWVLEAIARGTAAANAATVPNECLPVFGVLEKAERLLAACGNEARQLVGAETRSLLENECCKVFARLADPRLYRFSNFESNQRLMKSGTHRPRKG